MSRGRWPTNRARRELERMRKFRKEARWVIGKRKNQRGKSVEKAANKLLLKMTELKKINKVVFVSRCSWMDFVWKTDVIVENIHGKNVPIQIKSSNLDVEEFIRRHKRFFEKKFGSLPVIFLLRVDDSGENQIQSLADKINNWKGHFKYKEGHLRYTEFFDLTKHTHLGNSRKLRVDAFFQWIKDKENRRRSNESPQPPA